MRSHFTWREVTTEMDIRKFFGGGGPQPSKPSDKGSSQSHNSKPPKKVGGKGKASSSVLPTKKGPSSRCEPKKTEKLPKTIDDDDDIEIIDSDTEDFANVTTTVKNKTSKSDVHNSKQQPGHGVSEDSKSKQEENRSCYFGDQAKSSKLGVVDKLEPGAEVKSAEEKSPNASQGKKKSGVTSTSSKEPDKVKSMVKKDDKNHEMDIDSGSEESPMVKRTQSKKRRAKELSSDDELLDEPKSSPKKKLKTKKSSPVYACDTESDEDPLPRDKPKRKSQKRSLEYDSDDGRPNILDAFSRASAKPSASAGKSLKTKPEEEKRLVSPADFFGVTPVQSKTTAAPKKAVEPVMPLDMDFDNSDVADNNNLPEKQNEEGVKKMKFDTAAATSSSKQSTGVSISSKISSKLKSEDSSPTVSQSKGTGKKVPSPAKNADKVSTPLKASSSTPVRHAADSESASVRDKGSLQKKGSNFRGFMNREPPRALGSRDLPKGKDNCLEGLTFVLSGVLESIDRDDTKSLIERYGGKVTTSVSRNTSYLVLGRDAGESKVTKANELGTKKLDEDGLFELIESLPAKKSKYEVLAEQEMAKSSSQRTPSSSSTKKEHLILSGTSTPQTQDSQSTQLTDSPDVSQNISSASAESLLWVDKYKPTNMKQIIGQQGDKSNAKKLLAWLNNWHKNKDRKPVFGRTSDDGAGFKAALLSGPPGIGKTTTAQIVCETAGFSFVELNASDTRSKRSLQQEVSEALNNHTLAGFLGGSHPGSSLDGHKHCLVMDEVDGMAGNEDRGGVQELIQLIKNTKIPIICMCNDRNHPKIRSLSNYCFDLRFQRPRVEQIKGPLMSIIYKEGLKIPPAALQDIITAANHDIRQIIHNLSMWTARDKSLTYDELKAEANKAQKDLRLGPFDVCRKVFVGGEETANMTLIDKMELFFQDYSIGPLFVQENYIHVTPFASRGDVSKHLRCLSRAADGIACGDLVDAYVRRGQNWNLLPTQSIYASVVPGEAMRGSIGQMIQFPSWLGKNSTTSKNDRILQELCRHMRLHISANRRSLAMEYLPYLRQLITSPLVNEGGDGVDDTVTMLNAYDLLREDFDNILEVTSWSTTDNPMARVDSKVKAAFTRAYNKSSHLTPYSTDAAPKKRGRQPAGGDELDGLYEDADEAVGTQDDSEHSDDDLVADAMIKKKAPAKKTAKSKESASNEGNTKGKGRGRGKAAATTTQRKTKK